MDLHARLRRRALGLSLVAPLLLPLAVLAQQGAGSRPGASPTQVQPGPPPPPLEARPFADVLFGEVELGDLPSSRSIWSLIEVADSMSIVDRISNGGLYLGEANLLGSFGSSGTQAAFSFDGLDITDPERTGTPLAYPDPSTLRSVEVVAVLPAVDAAGGGPVVGLVPRAPATRFGGNFGGSYLPHPLQAKADASAAAPPIAHFGSAGEGSALFSGPLNAASGLLVSARRAQSRRFERADPTPLDSRVSSFFGHATTTPNAGNRLRLVASLDSASHPFAGRMRFPDRGVTARDAFWHSHAAWERTTAGGSAFNFSLGYDHASFGAPDAAPSPTIGVIERVREGPIGDSMLASSGSRARWQALVRARPSTGARHAVDVGFSAARLVSRTKAMPRAIIGELADTLPARIWDYSYGGPDMLRLGTDIAAWANDRLALGGRVTVEGGVRFESSGANARDNPTAIRWTTLLPRGALRVGLTESGSASFFLGYSVRRDRLPLGYLAYGDTSAPVARVYRWVDANRDQQVQASEEGTLVALAGPGRRPDYATALDPKLVPPLARDFLVGFDFRLGRHWRMRLAGVDRHQQRLVASVNEGVTAADYAVRLLPDLGNDFLNPVDNRLLAVYDRSPASFGHDRMLLTNAPGHDGKQIGGDWTLERLFDGRWYMRLGFSAQRSDAYAANRGYLASENDQGVIGELFENPNALSYARGRLFFERGYIAKWSGGFVTAKGLHFGAVARYQDGQHFARMVVVPDLNQGPELIQAYTRGHSRFTFTFTLDGRVEKRFRTGSGGGVALVAEAFNLLNNAIEVEEDPVVTRTFRATTAVQPPRVVRIGLRLDF